MNKTPIQAWIEAARPKTLPASLSPVLVGSALAYRDGAFDMVPAVICLMVALLSQIASNFANDYFNKTTKKLFDKNIKDNFELLKNEKASHIMGESK